MARRVKAEAWVRKSRGCDFDIRGLLERVRDGVNTNDRLYHRAKEALVALRMFDDQLELLGWSDE